jgi:hypothetical protein
MMVIRFTISHVTIKAMVPELASFLSKIGTIASSQSCIQNSPQCQLTSRRPRGRSGERISGIRCVEPPRSAGKNDNSQKEFSPIPAPVHERYNRQSLGKDRPVWCTVETVVADISRTTRDPTSTDASSSSLSLNLLCHGSNC